jgi:hypothetical protein
MCNGDSIEGLGSEEGHKLKVLNANDNLFQLEF